METGEEAHSVMTLMGGGARKEAGFLRAESGAGEQRSQAGGRGPIGAGREREGLAFMPSLGASTDPETFPAKGRSGPLYLQLLPGGPLPAPEVTAG